MTSSMGRETYWKVSQDFAYVCGCITEFGCPVEQLQKTQAEAQKFKFADKKGKGKEKVRQSAFIQMLCCLTPFVPGILLARPSTYRPPRGQARASRRR